MSEKKGIYNLFVVCGTELLLFHLCFAGGDAIFLNAVYPLLGGIQGEQRYEFWYWAGFCSLFLIPTAAIWIYMRATDRTVLPTFAFQKGAGRALAIGSLAGAAMNTLCVLLAAATGCFTLTFSGFTPLTLVLVIFCFFTCSCEELFCRGYVQEYLKKRYPIEVAAAAGGVLFIFHHITNLKYFGFNQFFVLNVFLVGLLFTLLTLLTGSIWAAFGMHTLWNFNQQFIMGLPNSGASSCLSVFQGKGAVDGFFFNTTYGLEGAPGTTLIILVMLAILYLLYRKQQAAASTSTEGRPVHGI